MIVSFPQWAEKYDDPVVFNKSLRKLRENRFPGKQRSQE